jgi:nitroreductase/NAD-dependent dihydropyrimidine dehydrogenase PreA subunit
MAFLTVDQKKCTKDGICIKSCPVALLYAGDDGMPQPVADAEERCISCGHCISVCPHGALSLEKVALEQCQELPEGWNLSAAQVEALLKGRRSIRTYQQKSVDKPILEKLIDVARYAPTGINSQTVRWTVILEREKVIRLSALTIEWARQLIAQDAPIAKSVRMEKLVQAYESGKDLICRGAPHVVYAYALKDDMMGASSSTIALTYFELAAVSMGLGTCWAGYVHMALNASPECRKAAGINSRCGCFGAMLVGYPAYSYQRIPPRNKPHINFK